MVKVCELCGRPLLARNATTVRTCSSPCRQALYRWRNAKNKQRYALKRPKGDRSTAKAKKILYRRKGKV